MDRRFSNSIGFQQTAGTLYVSEAVSTLSNPVPTEYETGSYFDRYHTSTNASMARFINRANKAYMVDGFVRISVDRHAEMFKDFDFEGDPTAVAYIKRRLAMMSLRTGEHWKTTVSRYAHEYFKNGNPMFLKVRSSLEQSEGVLRPLYEEKPYPLAGLFILSPTVVTPYIDNGSCYGWRLEKRKIDEKIRTTSGQPLSIKQALMKKTPNPTKSNDVLLKNGLDIVHTPYKKPAESHWGFGLTFSALEDVSLLRNIEQTTAIGIKKNAIPLLWHRILRPSNPMIDPKIELNQVLQMHRNMTQDGVIATPGTHELKILGSESQAMRTEGYLKYYASRCFSGLGVSPFLMGFEPGTIGTAEAAVELLMNRIRFCQQELSINFEMFILNELLWEGGWDPYTKEEHQVRLIFKEMDEARMIKLRSHFADLYTKSFVGFDEGRKAVGLVNPVADADLYLNKVAIPLEMAKGDAKAISAEITAKARPKPSKEYVVDFFEKSYSSMFLDDFINACVREFGIDLAEFEEGIKALSFDHAGVLEYLKLVIDEKYKEQDGE